MWNEGEEKEYKEQMVQMCYLLVTHDALPHTPIAGNM